MFLRRYIFRLKNIHTVTNITRMRPFLVQTFKNYSSAQQKIENPPVKGSKLSKKGPGLKEFLIAGQNLPIQSKITTENVPYLNAKDYNGNGRKVYFEVYGCQMNVNDTEVVWSILKDNGYVKVDDIKNADVALIITCAIREGAESRIWTRLTQLRNLKSQIATLGRDLQVGVLGCMAERLKTQLLEKERSVDVVGGPDSYKDLPRLLAMSNKSQAAVNVLLSLDETYADVMPVRLNKDAVTAFVSIMRGCDNMCTYCIVPFTRGRERSRPIDSIENEAKLLADQGIKEMTLLGQNVNSYRDLSADTARQQETQLVSGFKTVYKTKKGGLRFAELLERIAIAVPEMRIRFTSPHPKDFPDEVLTVMQRYPNICKNIHLPAQSGNSDVLERMRRGYTREAYLELVEHIRTVMPGIGLSSDFISGFCGETEEEFADTISLMERVKYHVAYVFAYSMREKTTAHRRFTDDVPEDVKMKRVHEMAKVYRRGAEEANASFVGQHQLILVEGVSKRSELDYFGRNDANIKVIFPIDAPIPMSSGSQSKQLIKPGDFIVTKIISSNSQVLKGIPLYHSSITDFYNQ